MFRNLKNWSFITDKELECFTFNHKRVCNKNCTSFLNLIKGFLIYLVDQCFLIVKESEFLDRHLKVILQESRSYVKDSGVFVKTMGQIGGIPKNTILVTSDVVRLYYKLVNIAQIDFFFWWLILFSISAVLNSFYNLSFEIKVFFLWHTFLWLFIFIIVAF